MLDCYRWKSKSHCSTVIHRPIAIGIVRSLLSPLPNGILDFNQSCNSNSDRFCLSHQRWQFYIYPCTISCITFCPSPPPVEYQQELRSLTALLFPKAFSPKNSCLFTCSFLQSVPASTWPILYVSCSFAQLTFAVSRLLRRNFSSPQPLLKGFDPSDIPSDSRVSIGFFESCSASNYFWTFWLVFLSGWERVLAVLVSTHTKIKCLIFLCDWLRWNVHGFCA